MSENGKDYSETLNLPKTEFPMRANLPQNEPKIQEEVFEKGLYKEILKKNEGHPQYVLHDGPPYANGEIHIGHAMNKILKDSIVRFKNLQGYYTPYIPGFDTHGLPTEKKAISVLNLDRSKVSITEFRNICRDFTLEYAEKQIEGFKRLGVLGEWDNVYKTLEPRFEARQIEVFGKMYKKGYIYKGLKPVYWCTDCETALAEAEIEYKDHKTTSIYVKFPVVDTKGIKELENTNFVIWTTTPWTLPGNMGITIGGDFEYSVIETPKGNLIIATELVEKVMQKAEIEDYRTIKTFKGSELEGVLCKHPFLDRTSRVVLGSDDTIVVELGTGTGAVHTAPGYGKEDYLCSLKNNLEIVVTVNDKGHQTEGAGPFNGMFYDKSNKAIIEWLDENGYLLSKEDINHSYPHCWRCKKPIIFRATNQWFASVEGFRKEALEEIKKVKWLPAWGEDRITEMVKDRNDWCISRQRTWGVPIPIFYCKECGKPFLNDESIEKISKIFREKGSNAWFEMSENELMPEGSKCSCGCTEFKKETDIMDVWFDSGTSYLGVLDERGIKLPADLYLEGQDQYRGWFQSSLLTSVAAFGKAPYKEVITHGFVTDGEGRKMSKSLGNGIAPQDVIKEYGADILRLWVLSSDYKADIGISKEILKQITEVYRKIRNTAKYILANISDFDVKNEKVEYNDLLEIDKWALTRLNKLVKECTDAFETYEFHLAYNSINRFCIIDMSNFYLDIIKDRLYTEKAKSVERRAAQTVMYEILKALVVILTPMIPFTTEEIYKYMPHEKENLKSPMMLEWPKVKEEYENEELEKDWKNILQLKEIVSKKLEEARAEKIIGHSLNANVILKLKTEKYNEFKGKEELLQTVFIVSGVEIIEDNNIADDIEATVEIAKGEKCERCWTYSTTVGEDEEHPTICAKCRKALE